MSFQLCMCDEYGSTSIIKTSQNATELVTEAKKLVSTDNMENALTRDEQAKNWNSCYVEFLDEDGEVIDNAIYAGKTGGGKHKLYLIGENGVEEHRLDDVDVKVRFYIGELVTDRKNSQKTVLYAQVPSKTHVGTYVLVDDIKSRDMEGKTLYFINKTK